MLSPNLKFAYLDNTNYHCPSDYSDSMVIGLIRGLILKNYLMAVPVNTKTLQ